LCIAILGQDNKINNVKIEDFYPAGQYLTKKDYINEKYSSVSELVSGETDDHAILFISLLDIEKINTDELLVYLKSKKLKIEDLKTQVRKLICLYDFLKYRKQK